MRGDRGAPNRPLSTKGIFMKRNGWLLVFMLILTTYYLSSIPGLRVLPLFKQVNIFLQGIDISISHLVRRIAEHLPEQLLPARTLTSDFLIYARANPLIIEFLLRKTAHVILFFFITIAFFLLIRHYFRNPWFAAIVSAVAATLVAVLDEYYQSFVPGRSGSMVDVAIDMVGISAATALIFFALFITSRYRS